MEQYTVTGMSCAACSARVEKSVLKVEGVTSCSVSLLTNSMGVEGTASPDSIINAVRNAGYGAALKGGNARTGKGSAVAGEGARDEDMLKDRDTPALRKRLVCSAGFLLVLMYFSMGNMMWNWPVPSFLEHNHVAMGLLQLLLTAVIMIINQKFFVSGFKGMIHLAPNMDTLVALGSGAAFVYSTYALFAMTDAQVNGDMAGVAAYMHEFYFESAAMILTLITVGKMLEAKSKGKTTSALRGLMRLAPKTAVIMRQVDEKDVDNMMEACHEQEKVPADKDNDAVKTGGPYRYTEVEVPIEQVNTGDIFIVRPGENIPVDGVVIEGNSAVNEAALTGESIPADKEPGDTVSAATVNQSGYLRCRATRVGEDTTLSQIIKMVSDAAATKAPIAKVADRVSGVFVPAVIAVAIITAAAWLIAGEGIGFALARGISVLVISCPCALGLATPVAIMVGSGVGAREGIMFKTAVSLEETGKIRVVALDKTGTVTNGTPRVTDVAPADGILNQELINYAYALEKKSEHPLAKAVMEYAAEYDRKDNGKDTLSVTEVEDFTALPGNGLKGMYDGRRLAGGNYNFIHGMTGELPDCILKQAQKLSQEGKTPLYFAIDDRFLGMIAVADVIKEDSRQAVREMQDMGLKVVMLTGDNERTARAIGKQAGVDDVIAGVLPDGKESVIRELKKKGRVAMVGDGINDAPALTCADIGIAIGAGTDIAIDAADVVLMKSRMKDVPAAIRLSRMTLRNIHENLFWAFIYNVIGIPLAAGIWIPLFGWQLNPMFGAAAMSLSSFCVVSNALRLNWKDIYKAGRNIKLNHAINNNILKEDLTMKKTMKIEGMMCGHCEARVKKVLEELDGVKSAQVSHEKGMAVVESDAEISDDILKEAVEAQDYKVISIS